MPSSRESGVVTMTVCQKCGVKGETNLLIYCVKCQDSAVHHYCLDNVSPDDDQIIWICEECAPNIARIEPSRNSERINLRKDQAVEVQIKWKNRLNKNSSSTAKRVVHKDRMAETAQLRGDYSLPGEEMKNHHSFDGTCEKQGHRKQRRRLMLEDEGSSQEQCELIARASPLASYGHYAPLNISYIQPSSESDNYVCAQPVIDPIWRGCFSITNEKNNTLVGIMAHLSSKACKKVSDKANAMSSMLDVEILARCDAWPKSFQRSPPTDNCIALYFFPEYERDEKVFDGLLDDIIEHNLTLKAVIDDVELLIFSSLELPQQHWRFRRKYYLWGVFKQKKNSITLEKKSTTNNREK